MTDSSASKTVRFTRWLPGLFLVSAILFFASGWQRGSNTDLPMAIGFLLAAQYNYFYPAIAAGSLRGEPGPVRYKSISQVLSWIGLAMVFSALIVSWLT